MFCYFLIVLLITIFNSVSADINAHRLTKYSYNDLIITDKNCNKIWYCSSYNTDNDCYKFCHNNKKES